MKRSEAYDMIADRLNYFEPKETPTIEKIVSLNQSGGKPMSKSITLSEVVSTEPAGYAGNIAFELMRSGTAIACKLHRTPDKLGGSVALYTHPHEWKSIDTAPKDGTTVIVAVPILNNKDNGYNVTAARYEDIYYVNHDYTGWVQMQDEEGVSAIWTPHFWMPLPNPPGGGK